MLIFMEFLVSYNEDMKVENKDRAINWQ